MSELPVNTQPAEVDNGHFEVSPLIPSKVVDSFLNLKPGYDPSIGLPSPDELDLLMSTEGPIVVTGFNERGNPELHLVNLVMSNEEESIPAKLQGAIIMYRIAVDGGNEGNIKQKANNLVAEMNRHELTVEVVSVAGGTQTEDSTQLPNNTGDLPSSNRASAKGRDNNVVKDRDVHITKKPSKRPKKIANLLMSAGIAVASVLGGPRPALSNDYQSPIAYDLNLGGQPFTNEQIKVLNELLDTTNNSDVANKSLICSLNSCPEGVKQIVIPIIDAYTSDVNQTGGAESIDEASSEATESQQQQQDVVTEEASELQQAKEAKEQITNILNEVIGESVKVTKITPDEYGGFSFSAEVWEQEELGYFLSTPAGIFLIHASSDYLKYDLPKEVYFTPEEIDAIRSGNFTFSAFGETEREAIEVWLKILYTANNLPELGDDERLTPMWLYNKALNTDIPNTDIPSNNVVISIGKSTRVSVDEGPEEENLKNYGLYGVPILSVIPSGSEATRLGFTVVSGGSTLHLVIDPMLSAIAPLDGRVEKHLAMLKAIGKEIPPTDVTYTRMVNQVIWRALVYALQISKYNVSGPSVQFTAGGKAFYGHLGRPFGALVDLTSIGGIQDMTGAEAELHERFTLALRSLGPGEEIPPEFKDYVPPYKGLLRLQLP